MTDAMSERSSPKRNEFAEALHRSEERFRRVVEAAPNAMVMTNSNGQIEMVNAQAERLFGYSRAELLSQPIEMLLPHRFRAQHPGLRKMFFRDLRPRAMEVGRDLFVRTRDGKEIPVEIGLNPIDTEDGTMVLAAVVDITDRAQRLQQVNTKLEERTRQLEAANRELESFAYSVSHDLRAPLRSMDGFSQALLEDFGDKLDEQAKDYLTRIRRASVRMAQVIDDLLKLSRVTRSEIVRESIDLSALARGIVADFRERDPGRDVEVDIVANLSGCADTRLIRTALENFLENAWKFTSRKVGARIAFGCRETNGERVYFVTDNGAGFDMAYADKLFTPFQQLHSEQEFEGSGIGLATVARVVHRHGGKVWIESAVGEGTTVYFTL